MDGENVGNCKQGKGSPWGHFPVKRSTYLLHPLPALSSMHPDGRDTLEPQGWIPMPHPQPYVILTKALVHQRQGAVIEASGTQCSLGPFGISSG